MVLTHKIDFAASRSAGVTSTLSSFDMVMLLRKHANRVPNKTSIIIVRPVIRTIMYLCGEALPFLHGRALIVVDIFKSNPLTIVTSKPFGGNDINLAGEPGIGCYAIK
jgi:hypothetical protein